MSLAGFTKKKKKKSKKPKAFKLRTEEAIIQETKKPVVVPETPVPQQEDGWLDEETHSTPTYNTLATQIGVVDTGGEKDKPASENFAQEMEDKKRRMILHDARRAAAKKSEEKKDAPPPKPAAVPRFMASRFAAKKLDIADETAFPTLGGGPTPTVVTQAVENLWMKTEEENAELIHMALKAEKKDFVSCTQFWGYELGYFFKNGPQGLGYYKDVHARDIYAPEVVEPTAEELAALAAAESKEAGGGKSRFSKKKKKKKKPKEGEEGEEGEVKEKKKKKKKKKDKSGDAADGETKEKKKKKKKKKAAAAAAAAAAADAEPAATEDAEAAA